MDMTFEEWRSSFDMGKNKRMEDDLRDCWEASEAKKNQEISKLLDEKTELRRCLKEAIDAIQVFHGPGWELYRDYSPEMKRWKAALETDQALAMPDESPLFCQKPSSTKEVFSTTEEDAT